MFLSTLKGILLVVEAIPPKRLLMFHASKHPFSPLPCDPHFERTSEALALEIPKKRRKRKGSSNWH
jgi:hypothetical protein